jgi:ubiquinone/menaquinone biosynthesis C-methylase UbiE
MSHYHPEPYWSDVAKRIKSRKGENVIAGDDEPYYRYKRNKFLSLLQEVDFRGKNVLEIGSGPGGNLKALLAQSPAQLTGADISDDMIGLAKSHLPESVHLVKTNGTSLPFADQSFDRVFTATVLQHNTDESMLLQLISEICRVSKEKVYIFESIDHKTSGDELCYWRPVADYERWFGQHGFQLISKKFINIRVSWMVCGIIRKYLNPKSRVEGEPLNKFSVFLENITLPVTRILDMIFTSKKDVARLEFSRK